MTSLFLICALQVPSPYFTKPATENAAAIEYERAKIEKFIRKNNPDAEIFIHPEPQEDKLKRGGYERLPFTWRNQQIWIRRKEISDKRVRQAA